MATKPNHRRTAARHQRKLAKALGTLHPAYGDSDHTLGANPNGTHNAPDPADHPYYTRPNSPAQFTRRYYPGGAS